MLYILHITRCIKTSVFFKLQSVVIFLIELFLTKKMFLLRYLSIINTLFKKILGGQSYTFDFLLSF